MSIAAFAASGFGGTNQDEEKNLRRPHVGTGTGGNGFMGDTNKMLLAEGRDTTIFRSRTIEQDTEAP